jgi:hypothetical protein
VTAAAARGLVRRARSAALATTLRDDGGWAYASLVTVACDCDASPILLLSDLADHTRNLKANSRASLLFEAASGRANPQTGPRVTVLGHIEESDAAEHRRRFLARHPSARLYADFTDFRVYRMAVDRAHYVGGFGRAEWIGGEDLILAADAARVIAKSETEILERMNDGHGDVATLYATRLLGRHGSGWTLAAVDPEGFDIRRGSTLARLDFTHPEPDPRALLETLIALASQARDAGC